MSFRSRKVPFRSTKYAVLKQFAFSCSYFCGIWRFCIEIKGKITTKMIFQHETHELTKRNWGKTEQVWKGPKTVFSINSPSICKCCCYYYWIACAGTSFFAHTFHVSRVIARSLIVSGELFKSTNTVNK